MAKIKEDNSAVEKESSGVAVTIDKEKYQTSRTASGTKSLNNGDQVAVALTGLTLDEVQELADSFIGENDFRDRYAKLNIGMQRMNIGNRIRGHISKITVEADEEKKIKGVDGAALFEKAVAPYTKAASARAKEALKAKEAKAKEEKAA